MKKSERKKKDQLGIHPGTAANRLRKSILYDFAKRLDICWCYQCGASIDNIDEFTIEHKIPWLDSEDPVDLYYRLDNIAFSHASCNYSKARRKKAKPCPSVTAYRNGCRCDGCKEERRIYKRRRKEAKNLVVWFLDMEEQSK
jgi:hypothetical protein